MLQCTVLYWQMRSPKFVRFVHHPICPPPDLSAVRFVKLPKITVTQNYGMKSPTRHHYRSLLAATLLLGGSMSWMPAAFAEGTTGGTAISNTATATYVDANNPNTPINSTSNTVVVQVAEVAGITVTASGTSLGTDVNSNGQVNAGDTVNYTYTVTNVGNDPYQIPDS
jgi:hypothetical protein